jgi:hypothetical protein
VPINTKNKTSVSNEDYWAYQNEIYNTKTPAKNTSGNLYGETSFDLTINKDAKIDLGFLKPLLITAGGVLFIVLTTIILLKVIRLWILKRKMKLI